MDERSESCSERLLRKRLWLVSLAMLVVVMVTITGCSGGGDAGNRVPVSGLVTKGGQAVSSASLRFMPVDGNDGVASGGVVFGGEYAITQESGPTPGKAYTVFIDELNSGTGESGSGKKKAKPNRWQIPVDVPDGGSDQLNLVIP